MTDYYLKRTKPIRKTKVKATNPKRKRKNWARAYHSPKRVKFVCGLPCCVPRCGRTPSENAHTQAGGMGMKAGYETIAPLCATHHRELHQRGMGHFTLAYGVTAEMLADAASVTESWWRMSSGEY